MVAVSSDDLLDINLSHYERLYEDPFERYSFEVRSKTQIFESLQSQTKETLRGKKVLDIGFGSGDILLMASGKGAECYGVEIVEAAMTKLKKIYPAAHIFKSRASLLPLKPDFFDIIVCSHVLEHENNEKEALREMVRVLKPSGKIFLGVPAEAVGETELHARLYDLVAIKGLADTFGLEIIRSQVYGSRNFQIICYAISFVAVRASNHNGKKIEPDKHDVPRYSLVRRLYHGIIVPFLLFLYGLDAVLPIGKARPIEIWAILRKKI